MRDTSELRKPKTMGPGGGQASGRTSLYDELTWRYVDSAPLSHRKSLGQYFTPRVIREALLALIPPGEYSNILDPASGTGEFLLSAASRFPGAELVGWEIDPALVEISRNLVTRAKVHRTDALSSDVAECYDLVIGNPPYFEFRPDDEVRRGFSGVISGRPNIFAFFFQVGLQALKPGGILAYVVPQSMNNGAYFSALREYILQQAEIVALKTYCDEGLFPDAQQAVMILVLRKGGKGQRFVFRRNGAIIFTQDPAALEAAFLGRSTLGELGFRVRTGTIVWNQNKDRLTDDPASGHPLLWASNITDRGLCFPNYGKRKQYVCVENPLIGPAIIVNRITGHSIKATLRTAVVPTDMRFFGENHLNVVLPPGHNLPLLANGPQRADEDFLRAVARAIASDETTAVARMITGNTQISATELEHLLPLRLIPSPEEAAQLASG